MTMTPRPLSALGARARHAILRALGLKWGDDALVTAGMLHSLNRASFNYMPNCGPVTIKEIVDWLEERGQHLNNCPYCGTKLS